MEKPKYDINKYKQGSTTKHKEAWQELAEEMTKWFDTNCYPIFYRESPQFIKEAFRQSKAQDIHSIRYFWWWIKHQKENAEIIKNTKKKEAKVCKNCGAHLTENQRFSTLIWKEKGKLRCSRWHIPMCELSTTKGT